MFLFVMLLVCSSCMLDIVMINDEFMHMFAKRLAQYLSELSDRYYVSMVLKYCLPADALYTPGHVVDRECDTLVESFCSSLSVCRTSRTRLRRESSSVLDLLSNVPYA
jgi:hypothetical protein